MENRFHLIPSVKISNLFFGCLSLGVTGLLLLILFSTEFDLFPDGLFLLMVVYGFPLGIYHITFAINSSISITETGIYYQKPFFSVYCQWKCTKIGYTENDIYIFFDETAIVHRHLLERFPYGHRSFEIPLHLFIKNWQNDASWKNEKILILLNLVYPFLKKNIMEITSKTQ